MAASTRTLEARRQGASLPFVARAANWRDDGWGMRPRTKPKQARNRGAVSSESKSGTPTRMRRAPSASAVAATAADPRAANERQAHEGLDRLRASLLQLERSNRTADYVFCETGTWDRDAETLEVTLRAARDAGGSKPPTAFRD